jgi:hypothetical protein
LERKLRVAGREKKERRIMLRKMGVNRKVVSSVKYHGKVEHD